MHFRINGIEYKLVFQHATLRQMPSHFGAASGLTTVTIYKRGKDRHETDHGFVTISHTWTPKHHSVLIQFGNYCRVRGERQVLTHLLRTIKWDRPVRKIVWASYNNRSDVSYVPAIHVPIVRSVQIKAA